MEVFCKKNATLSDRIIIAEKWLGFVGTETHPEKRKREASKRRIGFPFEIIQFFFQKPNTFLEIEF